MGVVLLILRILLDIIILILGLALLLVLIVLFVPVHYRIKGVFNEEEKSADFKVRWLIATVKGDYKKEDGLKYKAKVLFFTLLDSEKKNKNKSKKDKEEIENSENLANLENLENLDESLPKNPLESIEGISKNAFEMFEKSEEPDESAGIINLNESTESAKSVVFEESVAATELEEIEENQKNPVDKVYDFLDKITDKAAETLDKIGDKLRSIEKKTDHVEQFLNKDFTQRTIKRGIKFLGKVLKAIKPRKGHGFVKFGLSNAADTGVWLGKIAMFYPFYGKWLVIEPDFYNKVFNMDMDFKGSIMIGPTAIRFLILYLRKDTKRTINLAKKI